MYLSFVNSPHENPGNLPLLTIAQQMVERRYAIFRVKMAYLRNANTHINLHGYKDVVPLGRFYPEFRGDTLSKHKVPMAPLATLQQL